MFAQPHPTIDGQFMYELNLTVASEDEWVSGESTTILCDESPHPYTVWVFEVLHQDTGASDCIIYGQEAALYSSEFPSCTVW